MATTIDDALDILHRTGPDLVGGNSNHGPMVAEALCTMGRPDAVLPWLEGYKRRFQDRLQARHPISPDGWKEALGDRSRSAAWVAFFDHALAEAPWPAVLQAWVPRLVPGLMAAATHGLIRTGHAVRSLAASETPQRLHELAEGLGYWAATFNALPESPSPARPPAGRRPSAAIAGVPILPKDKQISYGNITDRLQPLDAFPPFFDVAGSVDPSGEPSAFMSDLTETFAMVYLASATRGTVITFLHGVTGPAAVRTLLPYVSPDEQRRLMRYTWQACASFSSSAGGKTAPAPSPDAKLPSREELTERALATGDEHSIKFTEACFREYALNPKPVYILAAMDGVGRLG